MTRITFRRHPASRCAAAPTSTPSATASQAATSRCSRTSANCSASNPSPPPAPYTQHQLHHVTANVVCDARAVSGTTRMRVGRSTPRRLPVSSLRCVPLSPAPPPRPPPPPPPPAPLTSSPSLPPKSPHSLTSRRAPPIPTSLFTFPAPKSCSKNTTRTVMMRLMLRPCLMLCPCLRRRSAFDGGVQDALRGD